MSIITVHNLSVHYSRDGEIIPALRNISFEIEPGETLAIVGESGSGKSTVALSLMGLILPYEGKITGGEIIFDGRNLLVQSQEQWRSIRGKDIAIVLQDPFSSLNPVLTAGEQIAESVRHTLVAGNDIKATVLNALRETLFTDTERIYASYPHQLSGGQRQRVAIAMAIINHPRILIADEPTTALDVTTQKEVLDLLVRLKQELSLTMVFITHNLALAAMRADRVMIMREGTIVESGPTAAVFRHPHHAYTQALVAAVPRLKYREHIK
ncbi:MAG: ABC transporter ATP-binding protein [Elusimicrobia bacterium]|nr:ABC transporter ATP-binding protein [Elusimicrobiota bacterium]